MPLSVEYPTVCRHSSYNIVGSEKPLIIEEQNLDKKKLTQGLCMKDNYKEQQAGLRQWRTAESNEDSSIQPTSFKTFSNINPARYLDYTCGKTFRDATAMLFITSFENIPHWFLLISLSFSSSHSMGLDLNLQFSVENR